MQKGCWECKINATISFFFFPFFLTQTALVFSMKLKRGRKSLWWSLNFQHSFILDVRPQMDKNKENRNDTMHQETWHHTKAYLKIFQDFSQNFWNSHKWWRELLCTFPVSLSQFEGYTLLRLPLFCTLQLSIVHRLLVCSGPQVRWHSLSKHFTCPLSRVYGHICTHLSLFLFFPFSFFCCVTQ